MENIKNKIVKWFIENIIVPKAERIDIAGFIILKLSEERNNVNIREISIPEKILCNIESAIVTNKPEKGKYILYCTGKNFGYRYAKICKYPHIRNASVKQIDKFLDYFLTYMEAVFFGKNIKHSANFDKKIYNMQMEDYVVCGKNGLGYILTDGGCAGTWAYLVQDFSIEGVQTKCKGRGDDHCEVICAPPTYLKKNNIKYLTENNLKEDFEGLSSQYQMFNEVRETKYGKTSLKDLINANVFSLKNGQLSLNNERYILIEAGFLYMLEDGLRKMGEEKLIEKYAFEFAKDLIKKEKTTNIENFAMNLLSAMGFGDVLIIKRSGKYYVQFNYFPWTELAENSKFLYIKGFTAGLLSKKRNVILDGPKISTKNKFLSLTFVEK
ncbi:MAG: hypothetical protein N3D73_00880 [Candidatus Diapherotrites archaeon]|nr:hypothetical protein [Candidatus Diapherotrites archaeon]